MVVMLDPEEYLPWLQCGALEAPRYFRPWSGSLLAEPAPLVRAPKVAAAPPARDEILPPKAIKPMPPPAQPPSPPPPPAQGDLF